MTNIFRSWKMADFRMEDGSSDEDEDEEIVAQFFEELLTEGPDQGGGGDLMAAETRAAMLDDLLRQGVVDGRGLREMVREGGGRLAEMRREDFQNLDPARNHRDTIRMMMRRPRMVQFDRRLGVTVVGCRQYRRIQSILQNVQQRQANQNPAEHRCAFCPIKNRKLDASPHLKFQPATLRQQLLLHLGYSTFGKVGAQSADELPLPEALVAEVKRVHDELQSWRNEKRFDDTIREMTAYRCFFPNLHWVPGKTVLDRRATARMILQCDVGLYRPNEFILAATTCLEDEVNRLWPLLENRTRDNWLSVDSPHSHNPVAMYWIAKCGNQPARMKAALEKMASFCVDKGEKHFETLTYFWPIIVEAMGGVNSEKTKYLFDHSFHEAIERKNRDAAFFVWRQAPFEYYRSMMSAAHCCGARNAYYAFSMAVQLGQFDLVKFMWNKADAEQHNGMLLAEHAKSFCTAAENGFTDIAKLMWRDTSHNQRFVLLFEQSCGAFRRSCANGHVEIVRLLWEAASTEQRRQIFTMGQCEALSLACSSGRTSVVQYLLENLGEELTSRLVENQMDYVVLGRCLSAAATAVGKGPLESSVDGGLVLSYLFSDGNAFASKERLFSALLANDADALATLVERGEKSEKWDEIRSLLAIFDESQRGELRGRMSGRHAYLCGLSTEEFDDEISAAAVPAVSAAASGSSDPTPSSGRSTACIPKYRSLTISGT